MKNTPVWESLVFHIWILLTQHTKSNTWEIKTDKKGREFLRVYFEKVDLRPGKRVIKSLVVYRYKDSFGVLVNATGMQNNGKVWNRPFNFLMKNQATPVVLSEGKMLCTTVFDEWFLHHRIISVVDKYEGLEQPF